MCGDTGMCCKVCVGTHGSKFQPKGRASSWGRSPKTPTAQGKRLGAESFVLHCGFALLGPNLHCGFALLGPNLHCGYIAIPILNPFFKA